MTTKILKGAFAITLIFFDSPRVGNFSGDILGFITALGLAEGAVTIKRAKTKSDREELLASLIHLSIEV